MHLFKSPISYISVIQRPNPSTKININSKIKSLHKQEMTKVDQPVIVYSESSISMLN